MKNIHKPKKPVRSKSGITPLTVVLKPKKCDHGTCIYCPGGDFVPQSYTNKSPAIMRAMSLKYNIREQVKSRLDSLIKMGHPTEKIELIFIGGTFLQYPVDYQYECVKDCYDVLNGKKSKTLDNAKKLNEKAKHRVVAFCIENRPDNCSEQDIDRMREFGCTRVEIGVQILCNLVYKKTNRGHTIKDVVDATQRLKDAGFKVGYHIMPGIPFSNPKKDLTKFKLIFKDERFRPDQLKLYPCQIVESSPLAENYKKIGYVPYTNAQTKDILKKMFKIIPEYCRVMRVMREIPKEKMKVEAASTSMRGELHKELKDSGIKEIRMREIGFQEDVDLKTKLKIIEYKASKGHEYFLEIVNKDDVLFGLLRLRIKDKKAIVRELHVYGQSLVLGEKGKISQHKGLGKMLMNEAEKIAKKQGCKELNVISGVGVREYYRKLGYELEKSKSEFMVKSL
jgi:elongator complex protein 3 (tRNA carboxymethyluridine synthase)